MANIYDKASLVMIPSGTKTSKIFSQKPVNGDGDFTFSRSTAATRVNADGNIEKETQNLLLQSNSFDTTWNLSNATISGGQSGYDGTNDAWIFTTNVAGAAIQQSFSSTGVLTFSVYAKAGSVNGIRLRIDTNSDANGYFDLANGTSTSSGGIDSSIEDIGSGWYRCSIAHNVAGPVKVQFFTTDGSSNYDNGSIYIQDAQIEQGLVARDYIETTTAAVEGGITDNVPRLDYTDSSCPALLLEPQRTNIFNNSEYFQGAGWGTFSGATFGSSFVSSPEGLDNATTLNFAVGNESLIFYDYSSGSATFTISVYARSTSGKKFSFRNWNGTSAVRSSDFTTTTEWQRFTYTFTSELVNFGICNEAAGGVGSIEIWGAQAEAGSYATSYIPTYGTSVTRNQDNCNVDSVSNVPTAYPFVLNLEAHHTLNTTTGGLGFYDNSNQYYYYAIQLGSNNKIVVESRPEGVTQNILSSSSTYTEGFHKIAVLFENDTTMKLYINGELQGTKNDCVNNSFNTGFSDYVIGVYRSINTNPCSIRNVKIFNNALSNEELIDLTT